MSHTLNLDYVPADEIAGYLAKNNGHVLGSVAFGQGVRQQALSSGQLWLDIPVLGDYDGCYEVWTSSGSVAPCDSGDIKGAADGEILFGSIQLDQHPGDSLESLAKNAYTAIFDFIDQQEYSYLWRVWHYFPQINGPERGLERYRCFNVGRHEAFVASGRGVSEDSVPAASALGCNSGPLTIYFLAGKKPGKAIENPRQTKAYHYPEQFGPRSPTFARAMLLTRGEQQSFIISGTASVVGYETLHEGDLEKQTLETMRNIEALMQQVPASAIEGKLLLKVYLRHQTDLAQLRTQVEKVFGSHCRAVYLQSDICRSDLLLEIEGVGFNKVMQS